MIMCPLNTGECNHPILPKPKTAFIMAPSAQHRNTEHKTVIKNIIACLKLGKYEVIDGSTLTKHGDYFCSICQCAQGCAIGVALVYDGLNVGTIGNIYLETGIMQSFGKPVILYVDKKINLPSDYIRNYAIFYGLKNYITKTNNLLSDIKKLPKDLYRHIGQAALNAGDYEKASKYFQEAYLIAPRKEYLIKIISIGQALEQLRAIPKSYKQRLLENINYFCSTL